MTIPLRCIVDASVSVKQFIPDPLTAKVNQLFAHLAYPQTEIFVPDLFYIECANVAIAPPFCLHRAIIRINPALR